MALLLLSSCATGSSTDGFDLVSETLNERVGARAGPGDDSWPPGIDLKDGLNEPEAVAIALWRSPEFQEALCALGFARAELVRAETIPNPVLSLLFPVGPKQLAFALAWPMDTLWRRPKRIDLARLDTDRTAQLLVQGGLDLVRDVRTAYAELRRTRRVADVAGSLAALSRRRADVEGARARAGDSSQHEAARAEGEAQRAAAHAQSARAKVELARAQLAAIVGLPPGDATRSFVDDADRPGTPSVDADALTQEALAARPDLRAAELAIQAAAERAGLAERDAFALTAVLDASPRDNSNELDFGPGLDLPLPLFDRNQAGKEQATAEIARAARQYAVVRHRIANEILRASTELRDAQQTFAAFAGDVVPALRAAERAARVAHAAGDTSPLPWIDAEEGVQRAQGDLAEFAFARDRARAGLERSVGRKLE